MEWYIDHHQQNKLSKYLILCREERNSIENAISAVICQICCSDRYEVSCKV